MPRLPGGATAQVADSVLVKSEEELSCAAVVVPRRCLTFSRGREREEEQNGYRAVLQVHGRTKGVSSGTGFMAAQTDTLCWYDSCEFSCFIQIYLVSNVVYQVAEPSLPSAI